MQTFEIKDGVVVNVILINPNFRATYEQAQGSVLIDVPESVRIEIGDTYDAKTGTFWRDGENVEALSS